MPGSNISSVNQSAAPSRRGSRDQLSHAFSAPTLPTQGLDDQGAIGSSQSVSASGSHIPKDDAVKAQIQGLQEAKEMRAFLEKYGGQRLREVFWQMVKGEHPDAILLRLLRARKWDVDRAVAVLGSTAAWRVENNIEAVVAGAELELTKTRGGMNIFHNGISYIYGASAQGEPVYLIEVGRHFSASQTQDELKRGVILLQETLHSVMPPPVERKIVIFNMNNFGIRNMDWWCVFFMVKTMECFYVETLARVYVHGAPWIFKPIWTILKPLLDPVVRDKIRLTSDPKELEEFIPRDHLPKDSMKGEMDWGFEYPAPTPDENDLQKDSASKDALQDEYFGCCLELEKATRAVARILAQENSSRRRGTKRPAFYSEGQEDADDSGSMVGGDEYDESPELASLKAKRDVLATRVRIAWFKLRPYMVGKTMLDRWNVIQPDGSIVWRYPKLDGSVETQVLGEATSLGALQRNLAALEGLDGELAGSPAGPSSGFVPARRVSSIGSATSSEVRGMNGNKKNDRYNERLHRTASREAAEAAALSSLTPLPNQGQPAPSSRRPVASDPHVRRSTSSSTRSHASSVNHSLATIQQPSAPHTGAPTSVRTTVDTPATSVHPLEDEGEPFKLTEQPAYRRSEDHVPVHPLQR